MNTQQKITETIIKEFHLEMLPEPEREDVLARVGGILFQAILLRCLETLPEEGQTAFETMLDSGPRPEEILIYLEEKVPTFSSIVAEEMEKFKTESAELMKKALD